MFSFIYLGFLLLVLGFFAHYIFHRFEEQNHKIKTLGKILTSLTSEIKDYKFFKDLKFESDLTEHQVKEVRQGEGEEEEEGEGEEEGEEEEEKGKEVEVEDLKIDLKEAVNSKHHDVNILESINTNSLCIVSDDDTDYEEDEDDTESDDEENDIQSVFKQIGVSNGGVIGRIDRIDPLTLMSIFAGAEASMFTASYHKSAFDIDETIVEEVEEEVIEEEQEVKEEQVVKEVEKEKQVVEEEQVVEQVELDYKKMSVEQLRKCVSSKGLATKVSKLKKMELVELLENN